MTSGKFKDLSKLNGVVYIRANLHDSTQAIPRAIQAASSTFKKICILCWNRTETVLPSRASEQGNPVFRFSETAQPRSLRIVWCTIKYQWWILMSLWHLKPKYIQVLDLESLLPTCAYRLLFKTTIIYDMRDPFAYSYKLSRLATILAYSLDWVAMSFCTAFVVPDKSRLEYLGRYAKSGQPILVFPNTCDDFFEEVSSVNLKQYDLPSDKVKLGLMGYLNESRGASSVLKVCSTSNDLALVVVAGQCRSKELRKSFESSKACKWLGNLPRQQALALLKAIDALCLLYDPSVPVNRVAAPNKFFEALCAGTPIIAIKGTNVGDDVEKNGLGWVVEYGDEEALKGVIREIKENRSAYLALRTRCRSYYLRSGRLADRIVSYAKFYMDLT